MKETISRNKKTGVVIAIVVALLVGIVGSYLLARSNAQTVKPEHQASAGLLRPAGLGTAPYQYIAYSGSLDQSRRSTGVKQYFAAFVLADAGCVPAWGGTAAGRLDSPRASAVKADLAALRAQGGDAVISFGGAAGTDLSSACTDVPGLVAAYEQVVDMYQARRIDLDIEGLALSDKAAGQRRAQAISRLQQDHPELRVWVTLPVHGNGLTNDGLEVLDQLIAQNVRLSGINIMAMNYNARTKDMGREAVEAAEATHGQLRDLYPENSVQAIWKALMITVMAGHNNTPGEVFTLQDTDEVHEFASQKGVGTLSLWSVARDVQCANPAEPQPSVSCSGVPQQPFEFIRRLGGQNSD